MTAQMTQDRNHLAERAAPHRRRHLAIRGGFAAAFVGLAVLAGCSVDSGEGASSVSSASTSACSIDSVLKKCVIQTPYVAIKNTPPGSAPPASAGGCDGFNCVNFAGNFCRCAEDLCPGQVGKLVYQASVHCTNYYNCELVKVNHAVDIVCEPKAGDATRKSCVCVEPNGSNNDGKPYAYADSRQELGIDEDPPADFCTSPVCTAYMGPRYPATGEAWRPCKGNAVHESCGNTNGANAERCPSTCCTNRDGTVPNHCLECDRSKLLTCVEPDAGPPIAVEAPPPPPPPAMPGDAGAP